MGSVFTCLGLVALGEQAHACTIEGPQPYSMNFKLEDDAAPVLSAASVSISRAPDPGNEMECGGTGILTITVEATDDQTAQHDLGFFLVLVDGSAQLTPPEVVVTGDDAGELSMSFDDGGNAFAGTLEVRVVDRAGNRSEPVLVSASGDDITADEGCTCSAAGSPSSSYGGLWAVPALGLLARRRFAFAR